jgi:hypothetical protein
MCGVRQDKVRVLQGEADNDGCRDPGANVTVAHDKASVEIPAPWLSSFTITFLCDQSWLLTFKPVRVAFLVSFPSHYHAALTTLLLYIGLLSKTLKKNFDSVVRRIDIKKIALHRILSPFVK